MPNDIMGCFLHPISFPIENGLKRTLKFVILKLGFEIVSYLLFFYKKKGLML